MYHLKQVKNFKGAGGRNALGKNVYVCKYVCMYVCMRAGLCVWDRWKRIFQYWKGKSVKQEKGKEEKMESSTISFFISIHGTNTRAYAKERENFTPRLADSLF